MMVRDRLSLDRKWRFFGGDIPFPAIRGHHDSYNNAKAGTAGGAAGMDFDDALWASVDLPHDWAVETPIDQANNVSQGFHWRGIGWYRRNFLIPERYHGKHLELQFDGVATHCTVWVNGLVAARNWCGYTSFRIDITPFARYGEDLNSIAVRVDAEAQEGWWYEGAGIYRHTWLVVRNPVHIASDGAYLNPVRDINGKWTIPAEITLESSAKETARVRVDVAVIDPEGKEISAGNSNATVNALARRVVKIPIDVVSPQLWSVERPTLYTVRTSVHQDGELVDELRTNVGFRTIRFDAKKGFFLNDQPLKLKGVCNHQDHAGVGVAVPDSLWEYRLRRLKEMGANAYRCAHNPPAAEFLDAADRMGILVMDENRIFNTTDEYIRQLQWLITRDRNHPSVILWSVFNEEPFQGSEIGYEMVRRLAAAVKELDATRPVTAAQSGGMLNPINAALAADVGGFNYCHASYDPYHAAHPAQPITSSEDTSGVMTRGEYFTDLQGRCVLDSYDTQWQPWGLNQRTSWRLIDQRPFLAGTFVWTGFDYRGEPQPLEWPATGSSFGLMDQCGFPKAAYYIRQAQWIKDRPILELTPHWNWQGQEGQPIKVMALTNVSEVQLSLNGKVIERKKVDPYDMVEWHVPYQPGRLEAVGFKNGTEVVRSAVETTGPAVALKLVPDRTSLANDGADAMPVTVQAIDADGRVVPGSRPLARFSVKGDGEIIGVGSGDPLCHEADKGDCRTLFHGLAQVIVRSIAGGSGPLILTASADGMKAASATIQIIPSPAIPMIPEAVAVSLVRGWRMSPASEIKPDATREPGKTDMNTYTIVEAGQPVQLNGGRYVLLRTMFRPRAIIQKNGGVLEFRDFLGKATVWVDDQPAGEKLVAGKETFSIALPAGGGERRVVILVEGTPGQVVGLGGVVIARET